MEKVIKANLVTEISRRTGLVPEKSKEVVEAVVAVIKETLISGAQFEIRDFGILYPVKMAPKRVRDIGRGTSFVRPATTTIKFKPGKELLDAARAKQDK